jgi:hypothetical protein
VWNLFKNHSKSAKTRPQAHIIGEKAVEILKSLLPQQWVVRQFVPDYGIDLDVELFSSADKGRALGEHVFVQVKGVEGVKSKTIAVHGRMNVECSDETTDEEFEVEVVQQQLDTKLITTIEEMGNAVVVLLAVVDVESRKAYLVCLNDYIEKILIPENSEYDKQGHVTINIPVENVLCKGKGIEIIEWYGKRAKLYAFFNKVNYQQCELDYCVDDKVKMARYFARILGRLDVWSAGDHWGALRTYQDELQYFYDHGLTKIAAVLLSEDCKNGKDIEACEWDATLCGEGVSLKEVHTIQGIHILWQHLNSLAHVFENVAKEWFLPTGLMQTMKKC